MARRAFLVLVSILVVALGLNLMRDGITWDAFKMLAWLLFVIEVYSFSIRR